MCVWWNAMLCDVVSLLAGREADVGQRKIEERNVSWCDAML